jgi:hypothetical protein
MDDEVYKSEVYKSHDGLLAEIAELRRRIAELKTLQGDGQTGCELKNARDRFEYLLAFSPAIIYTTQASDGFACTYVTEGDCSIS